MLCACSLGTFAAKHQVPELLDQATQDTYKESIVQAKRVKAEIKPEVKPEVKAEADTGTKQEDATLPNGDVEMQDATATQEAGPVTVPETNGVSGSPK